MLEPSYLINVRMDCLFVFNENVIGIIIINPGSRYERLSIEWPFNYAPNLRGVGLIIPGAQEKTGPVRDCTQEWSETVVSLLNRGLGPSPNTRLDTSKPNRGWARSCPDPSWGRARTHPGGRALTPHGVEYERIQAQQGLGAVACMPNRGLDTVIPLPNLKLGTEKYIIPSWVMTFVWARSRPDQSWGRARTRPGPTGGLGTIIHSST